MNLKEHNDEFLYDDIFDDCNDLFFNDDGDRSLSQGNESNYSTGDYLTEQAFHNDLESQISITERSSKFLKEIYVSLLRIIRPLEKQGSYAKPPKKGA